MKKTLLLIAFLFSVTIYGQTPFPTGARFMNATKSDTLSGQTRIPILKAENGNLFNYYTEIDSLGTILGTAQEKKIDLVTSYHPVDDRFEGSSLDPKWTVNTGQVGTVQLLDTTFVGTSAKYDLTSRSRGILVQCRYAQGFQISQDYTLSNGESVILKASFGVNVSNNPADLIWAGLSLSDATPRGGNYVTLFLESNLDGWRFLQQRTGGTQIGAWGDLGEEPALATTDAYFRISKQGGSYNCFYSLDGKTWAVSAGSFTPASDFTKIFIYAGSFATKEAEPLPVVYFEWIRMGTNDYDPWPINYD